MKRELDLSFPRPVGFLLKFHEIVANWDGQCGRRIHVNIDKNILIFNLGFPEISPNVAKKPGDIRRATGAGEPFGSFRQVRIT